MRDRLAAELGIELGTETRWNFAVDDGSEAQWALSAAGGDSPYRFILTRSATLGGTPLPNPREDLFALSALGLTWLQMGDCAVQQPPCRELKAQPLILRVPFPGQMDPQSMDAELAPSPQTGGRVSTRGEADGEDFVLTFSWDWDGGGESIWTLSPTVGVVKFTDRFGGGSATTGHRL